MLSTVQAIKEKFFNDAQAVKRNFNILKNFFVILAFVPPFLILYYLYSWTFEQTYQGRTFLLFFLWLVSLEMILNWEKLQKSKVYKLASVRTVFFVIALLLPTIYVIIANYYGLNTMIKDFAAQNILPEDPLKIVHVSVVPISIEYLVFAVLSCLIILLAYGTNCLANFSISTLFLGIIGVLFTVDNFYPGGRLTPLQIFVPTTTTLAANVLNFMGYQTIGFINVDPFYGYLPGLYAWDPKNPSRAASFSIAWPCAGVESLLIYTVTILLFLKETPISWKQRIVYFVIGGVVTYFINILRIVTIFLLAMDYGFPSPQVQRFHDYYGMLYSMTWIISYPLIIIGGRVLWGKIRNWKIGTKKTVDFSTRTKLSD